MKTTRKKLCRQSFRNFGGLLLAFLLYAPVWPGIDIGECSDVSGYHEMRFSWVARHKSSGIVWNIME